MEVDGAVLQCESESQGQGSEKEKDGLAMWVDCQHAQNPGTRPQHDINQQGSVVELGA